MTYAKAEFCEIFQNGFKISFIDCSSFPIIGKIKDKKWVAPKFSLNFTEENH